MDVLESIGGVPTLTEIPDATITASRMSEAMDAVAGAVYRADGSLLGDSVRSSDREEEVRSEDPSSIDPARYTGKLGGPGDDLYLAEAVFGGHLFGGWGHNLVEAVSTAWAAPLLAKGLPVVFLPWGRFFHSSAPRTLRLLELAGWAGHPTVITSARTRVDRLLVPDRLVDLDATLYEQRPIAPTMELVYRDIVARSLPSPELAGSPRVFAARPTPHRRAHPEEQEIEGLFEEAGFAILRGWEMSVDDQARAFAAGSTVIGFSGSNLHNSVFAQPGSRVIEIRDLREIDRASSRTPLQSALCSLMHQEYRMVDSYFGSSARTAESIVSEVLKLYVGEGRQGRDL